MTRTAARFTQADVARILRGADQARVPRAGNEKEDHMDRKVLFSSLPHADDTLHPSVSTWRHPYADAVRR